MLVINVGMRFVFIISKYWIVTHDAGWVRT